MTNPMGQSSREACRRAANDAVTLLSSLGEIDALRYSWPFTVYTAVSALLISYQDFGAPDLEISRQAATRYDSIIELLRSLGRTWWAAAAKVRCRLYRSSLLF